MQQSVTNQQRKVPIENICSGGPYEEYEHWGDGDVTEKGNEIVLDNLKKKPYECHPNQKSTWCIPVLP